MMKPSQTPSEVELLTLVLFVNSVNTKILLKVLSALAGEKMLCKYLSAEQEPHQRRMLLMEGKKKARKYPLKSHTMSDAQCLPEIYVDR